VSAEFAPSSVTFGAANGWKVIPVTALLSFSITTLKGDAPAASGGPPRVIAPAPVGRLPERVPTEINGASDDVIERSPKTIDPIYRLAIIVPGPNY